MKASYSNCALAVALLLQTGLYAQTPSLRGHVSDPSGASIPGAQVRLKNSAGRELRQTTNEQGDYDFKSLIPGAYSMRVIREGFSLYEVESIDVRGPLKFDVQMIIAAEKQILNVEEEQNRVTADNQSNVGALVLTGEDLKTLSDDPDILAQELQALAGPGAGPNGGQIFIDGFTGGRLPPKSAIREIRVNQNPFSPEFDRIGFGRIEILTKPGADKFRGDAFFNFSDDAFNARNPFSPTKPPFQSRLYGGRISGPLNKRASYALDVENRSVDENAVVVATILNTQLVPEPFSTAVITPQSRLGVNPRFDYAINDRNTLVLRYAYGRTAADNQGIGNFSLPSRAFNTRDADHTVQATETFIINAKAINESRFQFQNSVTNQNGDNGQPAINVLEAFNGGGAQVGIADVTTNGIEYNNITSMTQGAHQIKFGGRIRWSNIEDRNLNNFGGTYTFAGGPAPVLNAQNQPTGATAVITSIERYRRTLFFQQQGLSAAQIRALGGGASQFSLTGGNPLASVSQADFGFFINDDWRLRPNLTIGYGVRYENQTNISSNLNFAPRLSVAWGIDGGKNKQAKTVLRVGAGVFYDRVQQNLTLQAQRFNGVNQLSYLVPNPDFFPAIPTVTSLAGNVVNLTQRPLDADLRAPYLIQTSIGIDRQLPKNVSVAVNYVFARGVHNLRARNINAPVNGVPPFGNVGNLFLVESTGFSRQHELRTNFNARTKFGFIFGAYRLGYNRNDTDGSGSNPANPYDLRPEYGRAAFDIRHFFISGSSFTLKYGLSLSPFVIARSGGAFNITTGRDNNGDGVFNDRPSLAAAGAAGPNIVANSYGIFNLTPLAGEAIVARNLGQAPGSFNLNLRLAKTFGFGTRGESGPGDGVMPPGMRTGGGPGGSGGGRGPGGGGPMMGGGGPPPGARGAFFGGNSGKRFNLTISVQAQNLLNIVNLAAPTGNLSSPFFGVSTQISGGGFGPGGGGGGGGFGGGGGGAANNRRLDLQVRFSF